MFIESIWRLSCRIGSFVAVLCAALMLSACEDEIPAAGLNSESVNNSAKKVMLIGAGPGEENAEWNAFIKPKLEEWGYIVDKLHTRAEILNYTEADFAPYDFIFLSETLDSRVPGMDRLKNAPLPMLNSDSMGAKETVFAFGGAQGILEPAKPIVFLESAEGHPLAAGYAPGTVVKFGGTGKKDCLLIWSKPTMDVIAIAAVQDDTSQMAVYGIEKGSKNAAGEIVEHRIATIGTHAWCYDNLTEDSEKLFKAGIEWVLAE